MGAFLKFLGFLFLIAVGVWIYFSFRIHKIEAEAFAFLQSKQPAIIEHWDERAFLAETPPQLLREHPKSEFDAMFARLSRLGNLKNAQIPKGEIINLRSALHGRPWQALYTTEAQFERGEAIIILHLAKIDNSWKITGLYVTTPLRRETNNAPQMHSTPRFPSSFHNPLDAASHK